MKQDDATGAQKLQTCFGEVRFASMQECDELVWTTVSIRVSWDTVIGVSAFLECFSMT